MAITAQATDNINLASGKTLTANCDYYGSGWITFYSPYKCPSDNGTLVTDGDFSTGSDTGRHLGVRPTAYVNIDFGGYHNISSVNVKFFHYPCSGCYSWVTDTTSLLNTTAWTQIALNTTSDNSGATENFTVTGSWLNIKQIEIDHTSQSAYTSYAQYYEIRVFGNNAIPTIPSISSPANASRHWNNTVNFTWDASVDTDTDTITYNWQIAEDSGFSTNLTQGNTTSLFSGSRATIDGKTYYLRVKSKDSYESSVWSTTVQFTENTIPTATTLTSDLGTHETNHTPQVNFTKGTDADIEDTVTTYVYVSTTNPPTTEEINTTGTTALLGSVTALVDGTTYYVRARSWDGYEWSDYSAVDTFRMNSKPSTPSLSLPSNLQTIITTLVNFSWSNSTDVESDSITYDLQINGSTYSTGISGITANATLIEATHNWSVRSYDGFEYTDWATVNTFYLVTMPGYIYDTSCTHGATWANCTWTDPLLNFDHLVITNKTGSNNTWDSNVTAGVQYKNWTLPKGSYNFSTRGASAGGTLNDTVVWLNTTVNNYSFDFTGKSISEAVIYQSSGTTTITVNIHDGDGNITNATVQITFGGVPVNYTMTQSGEAWSYSFQSSTTGVYTITNFYATDDYSDTSSSTWNQQFIIVPIPAGGSSPGGGGSPVVVPTVNNSNAIVPSVVNDLYNGTSGITIQAIAEDPIGNAVLWITFMASIIMIVLGILDKRTKEGTVGWGMILFALSSFALGMWV